MLFRSAPGNVIREAVLSSPIMLDPGFYYFALNFNSAGSAKLQGYSATSIFSYLGRFRQAAIGSDTLPATVTLSALSGTTMIPFFGISNV